MECPKSIQTHAGDLDLTLGAIRRALWWYQQGNEDKASDILIELMDIWTVKKVNDINGDFKEVYNRINHPQG